MRVGGLQAVRAYQFKERSFPNHIDGSCGETASDILDSGLSCAQYMRCINIDAQADQFCQYLCVAGKGIIGKKEIFFMDRVQPGDELFCSGHELLSPVNDAVKIDEVGCE